MNWTVRICAGMALCVLLVHAAEARAQDEEPELGWFDRAEFGLLMTSGNAEAESITLRNTLRRVWQDASFTLAAGALRAETSTISRVARGSVDSYDVIETSDSQLTAENYFLRGRYDREITESFFWFGGAGWERNEFAGIKNRFSAVAGVGHIWFADDIAHFRTDYGVTFTDQEDVVPDPATSDSFVGVRLSWDYGRKLNDKTSYANVFIVDGNADETSDFRADMTNSLAVAMSDKMALQVSFQLLFDNEPALTSVPLFDPSLPGSGFVGEVLAPLDDLDTILTASLVVDF